MNQVVYILLLFCLLFLIETKAINILLSFVAIMISLAFILPTITSNVGSIESEYYSYILILVQVSALTILFGFVIMLFPNLSHSTPITYRKTYSKGGIENNKEEKNRSLAFIKYIMLVVIGFIIISTLINIDLKSILTSFQLLNYQHSFINIQDIYNNLSTSDTLFLRKIGIMLYSVDHNIIKLLVLTIILLLAIISLFFLI